METQGLTTEQVMNGYGGAITGKKKKWYDCDQNKAPYSVLVAAVHAGD